MIVIKNLKKTYKIKKGTDVNALKGISLTLPQTGMIFILGKSGSGKSTLLNIIGGLDKPDSGEITVNDKPLHKFSAADFDYYRNTCVGFVFQNYNLIDELTVEQNIALALQLQKKTGYPNRVKEVLKTVDIEDLGKRKPNTLSGGQRQRVAIARVLIKPPDIILADEPTGALDSETGKGILDTLKKLSEKRLVLIVSHDRETAETYGDRIIEMKDGKITADKIPEKPSLHERKSDNDRLIKSGLPFGCALKLGLSGLARHKIRLIFTMIISVLAFTMFGAASATTLFDVKRSTADAVVDSGYNAALLSKEFLSDYTRIVSTNDREDESTESSQSENTYFGESEISEINKKTESSGLLFAGVFSLNDDLLPVSQNTDNFNGNSYLYVHDRANEQADYFNTDINWFSDCGEEYMKRAFGKDCLLAGTYPAQPDEIAISAYHYEFFRQYGYYDYSEADVPIEISSPQDLIGKTLSLYHSKLTLTITGIYDVGNIDERYDTLKNSYPDARSEETAGLKAEFDRIMENSFHTTAFVSKSFYDLYGDKTKKSTAANYNFGRATLDLKSNRFISDNDASLEYRVITDTELSSVSGVKIFFYDNTDIPNITDSQCLISISYFVSMAEQLYTSKRAGDTETYGETHTEFSQALTRLQTAQPAYSYRSPDIADVETVYRAMKKDWNEYIDARKAYYETFENLFYGNDNKPSEIVGIVYSEKFSQINGEAFYVFTPRFIKQNATEWKIFQTSRKTEYKEPDDIRYSFILSPTDNRNSETYTLLSLRDRDDSTDISYKWRNDLYLAVQDYKETFDIYGMPFLIAGLILGGFAALLFGNFITVSISGRQKEIGILRALGARNKDVFKIFITESSIISIICFVLSSICSAVACAIIDGFIKTTLTTFSILHFGILNALLLLGLIAVISFISTAIPILLSSKKQPIDNIRAV